MPPKPEAQLWVLGWAPRNTVIIKILAEGFCPGKYRKQARLTSLMQERLVICA